jgi:hypothetical protein
VRGHLFVPLWAVMRVETQRPDIRAITRQFGERSVINHIDK